MKTKVIFQKITGCNEKEREIILTAGKALEEALNSNIFKAKVLDHTWLGKKTFADNQGFTNLEIYNLIMSGKEVLRPIEDGIIDISITAFTPSIFNSKLVGYTYPNTSMQYINRKLLKKMSIGEVAGNIIHEYLHKQGFDHDFNWTPKREYSVPYAVGNIVKRIIEEALISP